MAHPPRFAALEVKRNVSEDFKDETPKSLGEEIRDTVHRDIRDKIRWARERRMHRRMMLRGGPPGIFFGLVILSLGVIFFLDQQGIYPARESFHFFWAAILIFWGVEFLLSFRHGQTQIGGAILVLLGTILLASDLGYLHIRVAALWPLILVALGLWILFSRMGGQYHIGPSHWSDWRTRQDAWAAPPGGPGSTPSGSASGISDSQFRQVSVLSGFKRRVTCQDFKYAHLGAVLGGFELDLRGAGIAGDEAVVEVACVLGGGEIRIPETWKLVIVADAVAGGVSDETHHPIDDPAKPPKRLILRGAAVFGGVVVRN
jgi:hypothetical protein